MAALNISISQAGREDDPRTIGMPECRAAALSLAHSFAADEVAQYLLSSDDMAHLSAEDKWKLHVDMMYYRVANAILRGVVTTIGPDYEGVAMWMPPGSRSGSLWTILRSGIWRLYFQLSTEGKKRFFEELLPLLQHAKANVLGPRNGQEYHLIFLGTKPSARGQGYAKRLLDHLIEKADAKMRPVYLESSAAVNISYYAMFGFALQQEISLKHGKTPVKLWIMVREPQPVQQNASSSVML